MDSLPSRFQAPPPLTALTIFKVNYNNGLTSLTMLGTLPNAAWPSLHDLPALQTLHISNALVERSHQLVAIAPRTPELLAAAVRQNNVMFEAQSVTQQARGTQGPADVVGQEALTRMRETIIADWNRFSQENQETLASVLLPLDRAAAKFETIYAEMHHYLTTLMKAAYSELDDAKFLSLDTPSTRAALKALPRIKKEDLSDFKNQHPNLDLFRTLSVKREKHFRLSRTLRGLELMHGNPDMPHHPISSPASYRTQHVGTMPNCLQLLVALYGLLEAKWHNPIEVEKFVRNWLAENFRSPKSMKRFHKAFPTMTESSIGEVLNEENTKGATLVHSLTAYVMGDTSEHANKVLAALNATGIIRDLQKAHYKAVFTPLFEALFMIMRGHNDHLTLVEEADKPACADGGYLSFLRAINEASGHASGGFQVEAIPCGAL